MKAMCIHQNERGESEKAIWFMIQSNDIQKKKHVECEVYLCICSQSSQEIIYCSKEIKTLLEHSSLFKI